MKMKMKKKTERDINQGSIEGMKGLKLLGETESKDEESQMYLKNNLNQIKKFFFLIFMINIKDFSIILLMKKKRVLTTKHFHLKLKVLTFLIIMVLCMSS